MQSAPSLGAAFVLVVAALVGCGDESVEAPTQWEFGGDRPVALHVPAGYDHREPTPLLVLLHGLGATGFVQTAYTGLGQLVDEEGILFAAPDGTVDPQGRQFWNATDACCDYYASGVDDVAYIGGLIEEISSVWNVDPARVYLVGHSNGGFMSYRVACDRADLVAGVVSLAGATWRDQAEACAPSRPVSVLQIHGDADDVILYAGAQSYPSAEGTVERWAATNGCAGELSLAPERLELDNAVAGQDTRIERYGPCDQDATVELWTIEGGSHVPRLNANFRAAVWAWLDARP
jgi:polyhydroxybutyrate depolymerase